MGIRLYWSPVMTTHVAGLNHVALKSHDLGAIPIKVHRSWTTQREGQREKGSIAEIRPCTITRAGMRSLWACRLSPWGWSLENTRQAAGRVSRWRGGGDLDLNPPAALKAGTPEDRQIDRPSPVFVASQAGGPRSTLTPSFQSCNLNTEIES